MAAGARLGDRRCNYAGAALLWTASVCRPALPRSPRLALFPGRCCPASLGLSSFSGNLASHRVPLPAPSSSSSLSFSILPLQAAKRSANTPPSYNIARCIGWREKPRRESRWGKVPKPHKSPSLVSGTGPSETFGRKETATQDPTDGDDASITIFYSRQETCRHSKRVV